MTTLQRATATARAHMGSSQHHLAPRQVGLACAEQFPQLTWVMHASSSMLRVILQAHLPCSEVVRWSSMTATLLRWAALGRAELAGFVP